MAKSIQVVEVRVNNVVTPIAGETVEIMLGRGETNTEAYVAGNNNIEVVSGLNTSTQIGGVKFDMPHIASTATEVDSWHEARGENLVFVRDINDVTYTLEQGVLATDTTLPFASDGKISIEFKGKPIKIA